MQFDLNLIEWLAEFMKLFLNNMFTSYKMYIDNVRRHIVIAIILIYYLP